MVSNGEKINTARKPKEKTEPFSKFKYIVCPTCKGILPYHYDVEIHDMYKPNRCPHCEQALYWDQRKEDYYIHKMALKTAKLLKIKEKYKNVGKGEENKDEN